MRFNPDYVRDILIFAEEYLDYTDKQSSVPNKHRTIRSCDIVSNQKFENYNKEELSRAVELLIQEEYFTFSVEPRYNVDNDLISATINGISWSGYELLDNIRNPKVWEAVKMKASKMGGIPLKVLAETAKILTTSLMTNPNAISDFLEGIKNIPNLF